MSSLRRSPEVKTPLEDDDLLSEILFRLPPQPSSLPRASLVCNRWHGLASDPGFIRRFRRHHCRHPPLLGFFVTGVELSFVPTLEAPDRVPPGRFSLQRADGDRFFSLGCRHGLLLMFNRKANQMLVWDPVTGDQNRLAIPPEITKYAEKARFDGINGAVLRVGPDAHFQVVLTVADNNDKQHRRALAWVYSSETGLWGDLISTPVLMSDHLSTYLYLHMADLPTLVFTSKPAVLAGNSLHWMLAGNFVGILEFDLEKQSLAVIGLPVHMGETGRIWIRRAEGGGLGLLFLSYRGASIQLQLWKRKTDCDGVASWELGRTIELDKLLSLLPWQVAVLILGFAEENNVVLLWICGVLFTVHLESLQFKKLCETDITSHYHPFESVYTAETGIGDDHDAADLLHQT